MSNNRLDDPVFVNASPPPEPPLLEVAEPCPACYGFGNLDPEGDPAMRCLNCGGTGHAPNGPEPQSVFKTDRYSTAQGLAAAARKFLDPDRDTWAEDLNALRVALAKYEEAS